MDVLISLLFALVFGLCVSFLISLIAEKIAKRRMTITERTALKSMNRVRTLLAIEERELTETEQRELWSEIMTYVATAHSEYYARRFANEADKRLSGVIENFSEKSNAILDDRVKSGEFPRH